MRRRIGAIGTLFAIAAIVPLADPAHARQDLDCRDFSFQEDAQAVFDANPSDPNRLDEDQGPDDGIACEALARRGIISPTASASPSAAVTTTPTTSASPSAPVTAAPTATPSRGVRGGLGGAVASGPGDWEMGIGLAFAAGAALAAGYVVRRRRH
ncbi:excalibur calcium-binding protein [Streptomyces sp. D2-8]|uniref:excalibur calcium-binding protein n=1 Tax=Streptomyces sp. D2-8 TaxID=2707767 RepID=UPI0020BF1EAF|nr:excalibur calcium-binding protein [Streptomyces sp. D2-8]MCK8437076.1 excalibur calcium-binding protein [Streptomyces sp. D2-8]